MDINLPYLISSVYELVTFDFFIKFAVIYFFIIWIALLLWVIKDISNRTNSIFLQVFSILIILFLTPLGVFIYLIIRPGKTLFEKYYEEIEDNLETFNQIIEEKNKKIFKETDQDIDSNIKCYECEGPINHSFKFCPKCETSLRNDCGGCGKSLFLDWKVCPYCGEKQNLKNKQEDSDYDIDDENEEPENNFEYKEIFENIPKEKPIKGIEDEVKEKDIL